VSELFFCFVWVLIKFGWEDTINQVIKELYLRCG